MPRNNGYIDPLLTGLAVDYSIKARGGLIGAKLFPRLGVSKPSGEYYKYTKEQAFKVTDDTFDSNGEARLISKFGEKVPYSTTPRGNKTFIKEDERRFMEGPFVKADKDFVLDIIDNIEKNQEKRIRDKILNLSNRSVVLTGTGSAKTNKWANGGGDPFTAIQEAIAKLFYKPNIMTLSEAVFDALEYHPILLAKLGEANMIKKVDEATLSKLFRINEVVIAEGKADFSKQKADKSVDPQVIWGNNVVFAYTDVRRDVPCAGKTLMVNYKEANEQGFVVRKWEEEKKGILGGYEIQVACDVDEHIVSEELLYSIQEVL